MSNLFFLRCETQNITRVHAVDQRGRDKDHCATFRRSGRAQDDPRFDFAPSLRLAG
jgi:hypothetical protein